MVRNEEGALDCLAHAMESKIRQGYINQSENLTDREKKGRDQIMRGIANQNWMLYNTDKSGKLCVDTVENYVKCMQVQVKNDEEVIPKRVLNAEKSINDQSKMWA